MAEEVSPAEIKVETVGHTKPSADTNTSQEPTSAQINGDSVQYSTNSAHVNVSRVGYICPTDENESRSKFLQLDRNWFCVNQVCQCFRIMPFGVQSHLIEEILIFLC